MTVQPRSVGPGMGGIIGLLLALCAGFAGFLSLQDLPWPMLLHAGAMTIAWGLLAPAGIVIARYFKITRQQDFPAHLDNHFWWNWHRILQYAAVGLSTGGFLAMAATNGLSLGSVHAQLGFLVVCAGWLQVLLGILRGSKGGPTETRMRGDHYDMTLRRRAFEAVHKSLGWIVVPFSVSAILTGMAMAGFPLLAMLAVCVVFTGFAALIAVFHRQGRWKPTYLAIWGKDGP